jgi:hypothetical protein
VEKSSEWVLNQSMAARISPSGQLIGRPRYETIPSLRSGFDFHSSSVGSLSPAALPAIEG